MKQGGYVLPLLMLLLAGGALTVGVDFGHISQRIEQAGSERTRSELARVADALAGYAMHYPDFHNISRYGLLPCPDRNGDGSDGSAPGAEGCGSSAEFVLGHVPYRTLGIAPPTDGSGNCIWYAVSWAYKNKSSAVGTFNWDSQGQFEVAAPGGSLMAGVNPHSHAAAVLIAPGAALPGQTRSGASYPCRRFASVAAQEAAEAAFVESAGGAPPTGLERFTIGSADSSTNNDIVAWLGPDDIFRRLQRNTAFISFLNAQLARVAALLTPLEAPLPDGATLGVIDHGPIPETGEYSALLYPSVTGVEIPSGDAKTQYDDWRPMFRYFRCNDDSACLDIDGAACRVVIAFAGARSGAQVRHDFAEQSNLANYFEDPNLIPAMIPTNSFTGPETIDLDPPSKDVFRCIS